MADNSPRGARLDHVSDAGDLVFVAGGEKFLVTVDDKLERAILEAKQIRLEATGQQMPQNHDTLPISKIQQLIRAGSTPAEVAEQYDLNEALVRRFSSSVQTEKQYAIEQFKRVPAPKESRAHIVEDLVEMAISSSRIERDSLAWSATRHGHEPWHIFADFTIDGRQMRAEWTWNMHDNSVVSLNDIAKRILEEQTLGTHRPDMIFEGPTAMLDGDGRSLVHHEQVEAGGEAASPAAPLIAEHTDGIRHPAVDTVARTARTAEDMANEAHGSENTEAGGNEEAHENHGVAAHGAQEDPAADTSDSADKGSESVGEPHTTPQGDNDGQKTYAAGTRGITSEQDTAIQDSTATDEMPRTARQPRTRRHGRSAVPSWDEILFGD